MRAASFVTRDFFATMLSLARLFQVATRRRARLFRATVDTADGVRHRGYLLFECSDEFCEEIREELRRLGSHVTFHDPRVKSESAGLLLEYWRGAEDHLWYWQLSSNGTTLAYGTPQPNLRRCLRAISALRQRDAPLPLRNLTPWAT